MQRLAVLASVLGAASSAAADDPLTRCDAIGCDALVVRHAQVQADLGLTVIQLAYEHPLGRHLAASISAGLFGSYFLPWFDLGDNVIGVGGGVRGTWFARETGRGFYIAPYFRAHRVSGDHDGMHGTGLGLTTGAFAGWAFGLTDRLDLRLGVGAQFIHQHLDTPAGKASTSVPFVALDLVVGYRL